MKRVTSAGLIVLAMLIAQPGTVGAQGITLTDITESAGIAFTHNNGATGNKYFPETVGAGAAFIDYNGDRFPDIFLANGTDWPGASDSDSTSKLYRNNPRDGTFTDVSAEAGLDLEMYAVGTAVADYDNDGDDDLFVTALGQNRLFRNSGNGTFEDRTEDAGLLGPEEFSTSAAWADYDNDGDVDLFEVNYVEWSIEDDILCPFLDIKIYCTPESYTGASLRLWVNNGNGTFIDGTEAARLFDTTSKGLGIATFDYNQDGWTDILVVNDREPNKLYENRGDGTFVDVGFLAGIAYSEDGVARAGMGVDAADYDRSGYPSVVIGNFSNEMLGLYHNEGDNDLFLDVAPRYELGRRSLLTLAFACLFMDYDLDGWLDVLATNGHVVEVIAQISTRVTYAQPPHMFRNLQGESFEEVTDSLGDEFASPRVGRGAAVADIDNDGDLDILMTTSGGPALLFRNDGGSNQGLRVRLEGNVSNRNGLGARVTVTAGEDIQTQTMRSGSGYLSQNELVLTFGLASHSSADRVEVKWPGGEVDILEDISSGFMFTVREGRGRAESLPYQ